MNKSTYKCISLTAFFLVSCIHSKVQNTKSWVVHLPQSETHLYAIGWGESRLQAEEDAKQTIASTIQSNISSVFSNTVSEITTDDKVYYEEMTQIQVKSISELVIPGIEVVDYYDEDNEQIACLVRILRNNLEGVLVDQQEKYRSQIYGFVFEGIKAEKIGKIGTALKLYFKAFSILPLLPYSLSIPINGNSIFEANSFIYSKIHLLLSGIECKCEYEKNTFNPQQSLVKFTLFNLSKGNPYDDLSLTIYNQVSNEIKNTDGKGQFSTHTENWREGTIVRLDIKINNTSFQPFANLTDLQIQEYHHVLKKHIGSKIINVACAINQDLKVYIHISKLMDNEPIAYGIFEQRLKSSLSNQPQLNFTENVDEADLVIEGVLNTSFSSQVPVLGFCYKSIGEIKLKSSLSSILLHSFSWVDTDETKTFNNDPQQAAIDSLNLLAGLIISEIEDYFENIYEFNN